MQSKREELVLLCVMLISLMGFLLHSCQYVCATCCLEEHNESGWFEKWDIIDDLKTFNIFCLKKKHCYTHFSSSYVNAYSLIKTTEQKCLKSKEAVGQNSLVPLRKKCFFSEGFQRISVKLTELLHSDYSSHNHILWGYVKKKFFSTQKGLQWTPFLRKHRKTWDINFKMGWNCTIAPSMVSGNGRPLPDTVVIRYWFRQ